MDELIQKNIYDISLTEDVSKLDTSISESVILKLNIFDILVTFEVSKLVNPIIFCSFSGK